MNPQLDHLNGRSVQSVDVLDAENQWAIRMEGGALIRNLDDERNPPTEIDGTILLSSSENEDATVLQFGYSGAEGTSVVAEIPLTTDQYEVLIPEVTPDEDLGEALPDDPSPDRVADGPEEQDEAP